MEAEDKVKELESQVAEAQARAAQAEAALGAAQNKWALERELAGAGVVDAEAASILAGAPGTDGRPFDVRAVVAELKRKRPYLFAGAPPTPRASAMSSTPPPAGADALARAAEEARASGDLKALLSYLRMRRAS